jgi:serine/threonine protein kinase
LGPRQGEPHKASRRPALGVAVAADRAALSSLVFVPGTDFAGYVIEEMVARGGMGAVYRATDPALDRTVALKVIAPEHTEDAAAVARFTAEAKLAAAIDHPNLVTIYRAGEWKGVLFLAMQLIPGTDLRTYLRLHRAPHVSWIERIVGQVASALDAAHSSGLVHRDVKPANILLGVPEGDERAYLTDFGITKRLDASTAALTRTNQWVGTPDYAASEQIRGANVDARTDVYSLGCVVHEMLTGHRPYEKESPVATLWAHLSDPPPAPCAHRPDLLPIFDAVVARATAKEPGNRFPTAGALAEGLAKAVGLQVLSEGQSRAPETKAAGNTTAIAESSTAPADVATAGAALVGTPIDPTREEIPEALVAEPSPPEPPASSHPATHPSADRPTSRRTVIAVAGALLVAAVVVGAVLALGNSSTSPGPQARNHATSPSLAQQVRSLNGIVQLFITGKRLSHVEHQYAAAAENRTAVLRRLDAFSAPPPLVAATRTFRAMTADSLLFNQLMAQGHVAASKKPDNAHNALRPLFLDEFNPYAQRYLGHRYAVSDL